MATLQQAREDEDGFEVRGSLRGLVETIVLVPDDGTLAIEVRGDLAAILALGANDNARPSGRARVAVLEIIEMIAGACNHRELHPLKIAV